MRGFLHTHQDYGLSLSRTFSLAGKPADLCFLCGLLALSLAELAGLDVLLRFRLCVRSHRRDSSDGFSSHVGAKRFE